MIKIFYITLLALVLTSCGGGSSSSSDFANNLGTEALPAKSEISGLWASLEGHNFLIAEDGSFITQITNLEDSYFDPGDFDLTNFSLPSYAAGKFTESSPGSFEAIDFQLGTGSFFNTLSIAEPVELEELVEPVTIPNTALLNFIESDQNTFFVVVQDEDCNASAVPGNEMLFMTMNCNEETSTFELLPLLGCPDSGDPSCVPLSNLYDFESSLNLIAGEYALLLPDFAGLPFTNNTNLAFSNDGEISGRIHGNLDCAVAGQVNLIDSRFNLYQMQWSSSDCSLDFFDGSNWTAYAHIIAASDNAAESVFILAYSEDFDQIVTESLILVTQ